MEYTAQNKTTLFIILNIVLTNNQLLTEDNDCKGLITCIWQTKHR